MELVILFMGLIVTILSSLYISRKVYRTLDAQGNKFSGFFSTIAFVVSLIGIGAIVLFVWSGATGGFSRR